MQRSTVWLLSAAAAAAVAIAAASVGSDGARAQEAPAEPPAQASAAPTAVSEETLRDVEVMRRVLVREALGGGSARQGHEYAAAWLTYHGTSTSEAYVVAGDGATFLLRTSDPVSASRETAKDDARDAGPSAWDEAEAELAGRPRAVRVRQEPDTYDAAKVAALRERVLRQLAEFGHRIRGLAAGSRLTVVVIGGPRGKYVAVTPRADSTGAAGAITDEFGRLQSRAVAVLLDGASSPATVLTIRVDLADCQAYSRGTLDFDGFRRRAVIGAY